ncbi:MAG: hypothetical protein AAF203_03455 [Pseudomonadota bacterium]
MTEAFNNEPIYAVMALIGTTLFVLKTLMLFVGGDTDSDLDGADLDDPAHVDGAETFTLVSIQSILAFFMGTGWIGLACREEWKLDSMTSLIYAGLFGVAMMLLSSFLTMKIKGLNAIPENKIDRKAIGLTGRAYTNIPEKGEGTGQVEITINGKQQILQASSGAGSIKAFDTVEVVFVDDSGHLTVEPI